jgi:hypothetical protein
MEYVFIMGGSRTGSTLTEQLLNNYTDVGIIPEMQLYWPRVIRKDFASILKEELGILTPDNIDQLIDLMYSQKFFGTFWETIEKYDIDRSKLREKIVNSDMSIKSILNAFISILTERYDKKIGGAKFPVHFAYIDKLLKWYPDCKIIHTIRDPRAIYLSQYTRHKTKKKNRIGFFVVAVQQLAHVASSFNGAVRMHEKLKDSCNYYLHKYEQAVMEPEKYWPLLCKFIGVKFNEKMLNPSVYHNTSYREQKVVTGIISTSVEKWKHELPSNIVLLIKLATGNSMKKVGYQF